jgi:hypothetical protein
MSVPASESSGDELPCEHNQGDEPPALSFTSHDDDLSKDQAVQAADKLKKKVGQKRGVEKKGETSKRHKKLPPPPSECPTCGFKNPKEFSTCQYPGCGKTICFTEGSAWGPDATTGCMQYCEVFAVNPAKGDCPTIMCDWHRTYLVDTFVCDLCRDRGLEISEDYWC